MAEPPDPPSAAWPGGIGGQLPTAAVVTPSAAATVHHVFMALSLLDDPTRQRARRRRSTVPRPKTSLRRSIVPAMSAPSGEKRTMVCRAFSAPGRPSGSNPPMRRPVDSLPTGGSYSAGQRPVAARGSPAGSRRDSLTCRGLAHLPRVGSPAGGSLTCRGRSPVSVRSPSSPAAACHGSTLRTAPATEPQCRRFLARPQAAARHARDHGPAVLLVAGLVAWLLLAKLGIHGGWSYVAMAVGELF